MDDSNTIMVNAQKTCVGGYTCPRCGQFVQTDMGVPHLCDTPGTETISSVDLTAMVQPEPQLLCLQSLMAEIGHAGCHVFVRFDPARERKKWTVMITDKQGRRDTDEPAKTLLKMWNELQGEK